MQPSQSSGPDEPHTPAGQALAVLMTIEQGLAEHDAVLMIRPDGIVVLVDSISSFGMWVFELKARAEHDVADQSHLYLATAETEVCGCPVCIVRGEFFPECLPLGAEVLAA